MSTPSTSTAAPGHYKLFLAQADTPSLPLVKGTFSSQSLKLFCLEYIIEREAEDRQVYPFS